MQWFTVPNFIHQLSDSYSFSMLIHNKVSFLDVEQEYEGQRIDNFLLSRLRGLPKSRLYRLLRKGEIRVNKGRIKPDYRLKAGDQVRIPPIVLPEKKEMAKVSSSFSDMLQKAVLFENEDWLVIDKPHQLAVHGGSGLSLGLIEALRQIKPECRYLELCHRIDKDTSGCLVVAKKRSALKRFHTALREKRLIKVYNALVVGRWPAAKNAVNLPLEKNILQSGERMVKVSPSGKVSKTLFKVLRKFEGYSFIEAQPVTGRTHQIRVHTLASGHPILGDKKYGFADANKKAKTMAEERLFLHAKSITLPMEDELFVVESPIPQAWNVLLDQLQVLS